MSFTDARLPGKTYKTERGRKLALTALEKRLRGTDAHFIAFGDEDHSVSATETTETAVTITKNPAPAIESAELLELRAFKAHADADAAARVDVENRRPAGPIFIRNLREVPVRLRFGDKKDGRTVNLQPRGMRGDLDRLKPGDEYDSALNDVGILFEVLTEAQVARVVQGQTTNQQAVHPALAHLLTPTGEPLTGGVVIEQEFNEQGFAAGGTIIVNGEHGSRVSIERPAAPQQTGTSIDMAVAPARAQLVGTQDRPVASVSLAIDPVDQAAYVASQGGVAELMRRDALARQKGAQGPEAGLGGLAHAPLVATRFDEGTLDPTTRAPEVPVGGQELAR